MNWELVFFVGFGIIFYLIHISFKQGIIQDMKLEIKDMIKEIRQEMKHEIQDIRQEMKHEIQKIRQEMKYEIHEMNIRFEKLFEQIDTNFKDVHKRLDYNENWGKHTYKMLKENTVLSLAKNDTRSNNGTFCQGSFIRYNGSLWYLTAFHCIYNKCTESILSNILLSNLPEREKFFDYNKPLVCSFTYPLNVDIVACKISKKDEANINLKFKVIDFEKEFKIPSIGEKYGRGCMHDAHKAFSFSTGIINGLSDNFETILDFDVYKGCSGGLISNTYGFVGIMIEMLFPSSKFDESFLHRPFFHKKYSAMLSTDVIKSYLDMSIEYKDDITLQITLNIFLNKN